MHGGDSAPSCSAFTHRGAFEEWSGPRLLLKSGLGNRGRSACCTTHVARFEFPRETGLLLRCAGKAGNPFQTKQGNGFSCRDQEGRRGSEEEVPGPSVFPSREPSVSGNFWGSHEGCQGPFCPSGRNKGLPLRRCHGQGPHLAKRWEPGGVSRVAAGFSSYEGDIRLPVGLALGSPNLPSSCEGKLGVALESLQGPRDLTTACVRDLIFLSWKAGISGLLSTLPCGVRPRLEGKPRTPLSSRVATRLSWSPLSGLKGVQPPLQFGDRTRDCSPGHAGKEGPLLARTGASQGFPRAAVPMGVFSRGTTRISGSLSCGAREVGSPGAWRGGARPGSRVTGGD